ncbi:purple acid phosphatase family protein [Pedobacter cryophilus]|uniref:Metallophosphoesterase family protein n=1 Tax=Pedobacter cryophilus TaxID=2571271 RepID=A0A4U1BYW7_9SPHI|nr:metallophosphoesterase family protein [Pedobacter cryophilus]TKB97678.1 metallophosphoesterase family protein [Pedobacter cryophilus]
MKRLLFTLVALACLHYSSLVFAQNSIYDDLPQFAKNWSKPTEQPDHIILTFSGDPSTQQSVTWRTDATIKNAVAQITIAYAAPRLRKTAVNVMAKTETMDATAIKTAEVVSNYHSVTFENLLPDTLYAYRVGDGKIWSEWFHFRTASKTAKPFSFLYVGDAQNFILELWSRLIRTGFSKAPEASFIIHAGDLVSEAHSERQWHEWFTAGGWIHGMLPSVPVPGNHEYRPLSDAPQPDKTKNLSVQWKPQFTLPENGPKSLSETTYFFDYQDTRFILLNSNTNQQEQVPWLESVLKDNPNKWTIVSFHHPIFSTANERDNQELREMWKPLLDKYKVDLVLQGHDHTYARGQAGSVAKNELAGINKLDPNAGTVYVVSVSGGKMYNFRKDLWNNYDANLERKAENTQLFQVIKIDGDQLLFEAYTATGELYDSFSLQKKQNAPNKFKEQVPSTSERLHNNTIPKY